MAKNALKMTIFIFSASFWLLLVPAYVYSAGSRETDLSNVDQMITDKEYDKAILFLTEFARHNPDQFDNAQFRLNRIYTLREEFNKTADMLIDVLLNDPENDELILELTTKLRSLEDEDSPVLVNFLSRIHDIAYFNVARNQLLDALENGRMLLDREDYEGAFLAYSAGMSIMRNEFYDGSFSSAITNQVRQETDRINNVMTSFRQTSAQLESVTTELTRAVNSGNHTRVPEIMNRLAPAMDNFIAQKQNLFSAVAVLERLLRDLQRANPDMGDRNHIAFIIRVVYGRTDQDIQEGMLGVFDGFWKKTVSSSLNAITLYLENTNNTGLASFNRLDYAASINNLSGIALYSDITPVFFSKHIQLKQAHSSLSVNFNNTIVLQEDLPLFLKIASINEASTSLRQAAAIPSRDQIDRTALINLRINRITASEALVIEQQTRNILNNQQREIENIKTRAVFLDNQISIHQNFAYIKNAITAIDILHNTINMEEQLSAQRFYNIAQADLDYHLAERKKQLEDARNLLDGQRSPDTEGVTVTYRYPAEALLILNPMLESTRENINRGNALLTQIRNEPPNVFSNTEVRNLSSSYQTAVNEITTVQSQGQAMAETARRNSAQANALRQDGERLFTEAQTAFRRRDYETATVRLDNATRRIDESLALQESAELREYRNTQLVGLGQQIAMAQNEAIITQVREFVNTARDQYFNGNFQQAEENLLRARNRWRIVSSEENAEVVYWLNMIQRAMSASSARTVPPTAPLYAEISQLLSEATRNYEEGMRLINSGQRAQGLAKFDEARVKTREVKLMFPVNQEAGILELRMEQFTDPRAFNAAFEQRLRTAVAGTRPQRRSLEAYGDLLNLAEINPTYPGIRNIIFQAEVDMGIRPPPPNPADIARSRELTASATRILDQNLTAQFDIALAQINEAITLNPQNAAAPRVKDRLLNRSNTTETSSFVLSNEDEVLYQQAIRELQAGNNLVAFAHVERIMQNPRNRNVPKVIELQRRIQAAL